MPQASLVSSTCSTATVSLFKELRGHKAQLRTCPAFPGGNIVHAKQGPTPRLAD